MTITDRQVEAGQAVYSKAMLSIYDWLVLRFSNRLVWRCPSKNIRAFDLRAVLSENLTAVRVEVVGCAALFSGRV
jgi:hypothetical protein